MKKPLVITVILMMMFFLSINTVFAQQNNNGDDPDDNYSHSIGTDPLLPIFNSFALIYGYNFHSRNELIIGFWYSYATITPSIYLEYPGAVQTTAMILGYRIYFWRGLHFEYQLLPGYNRFYEINEDRYYHSFGLYNEFRIGYRFTFKLFDIPFLVNIQWPLGFSLYESNEPDSFKEVNSQDPIFYIFYPNIYIGFRF